MSLLSVGVPLGSLYCSCGELGSSFGSRDLKNDHIFGILYIGNSWQGSEFPLCELSHHTYCTCLYFVHCSIIVMLLYLTCHLFSGVLWCVFICLFIDLLFLLCLIVGSSILWCLRRLIWVACGSPATCLMWHAVALELSNFSISCLTLLAGDMSKSILSSVMVLDMKSSSHKKNLKISQCNIITVSGETLWDYFVLVQHCTIHWCFCYLGKNFSKDWTGHELHLIVVCKSLWTSSKLCQDSFLLWTAPMRHTDPFQSCLTKLYFFYIFGIQGGQIMGWILHSLNLRISQW